MIFFAYIDQGYQSCSCCYIVGNPQPSGESSKRDQLWVINDAVVVALDDILVVTERFI